MPRYEHITQYINRIQAISTEAECRQLHQEFLDSCYNPFVLDRDYRSTLEARGAHDDPPRRARSAQPE